MESLVNDLQTNFLFGKCCRFERGRNRIVSGGGGRFGRKCLNHNFKNKTGFDCNRNCSIVD